LGLVLSASGFKLYGYSNSFQSHMAGYRASGTTVLHQSVDGMSSSGYAMLKVLPGFQVAPKFTAHLSTATCDLSPELSLWNSGLDDGSNSSLSNEIFAFSFTELSENATIPLKQKFISETSSLLSLPLELKSIVILDELRSKVFCGNLQNVNAKNYDEIKNSERFDRLFDVYSDGTEMFVLSAIDVVEDSLSVTARIVDATDCANLPVSLISYPMLQYSRVASGDLMVGSVSVPKPVGGLQWVRVTPEMKIVECVSVDGTADGIPVTTAPTAKPPTKKVTAGPKYTRAPTKSVESSASFASVSILSVALLLILI